ncbi:MAG: hypothetical protein CO042_01700 [Parcubacteria group bacterium CG_4_9_14_0_2_um_filter_41_8]|nr:MAG: hypothetical protein AUJ34_03180 [Parcubacteria group bacterium CG1_02_41_12]PIQ79901.1 MAG: hypothetical protein COV79_02870 [Parcubacteria group bacterium CG11_big_fil_rev_8_21_14_0_20_41_14]PIR56610.1 MAG: hypothetical protein COU72_05335 [Parcubacteria group bacterium CG10_big_fil_rev_8_21_14_0_10_41_35]PIZ82400.1 MAG: hypothetical protein COY02_00150 [Parcubacteria group bacterium CG_4_10_14_0_2_um_filter_41_6]PJC40826.1 MAG: hypothetical protein CO042_01700 [Parcubacteria group ba
MTNKQALQKSYSILSPYSDKQKWEFNNNLVHLKYITEYIPKTSVILDVGCGIGILDLALVLLGYQISGIDKYVFEESNSFSVDDIDDLRRVWEEHGLEILPKDILRDQIKEKYGAVISIATIEHQKDPKRFLQNIIALLSSNGLLYIATPNISHLLNRARFLFGLSPMSGHLKEWFEKGETYEGHWREYALGELRQMFESLNLQIMAAENIQSMKPGFPVKSLRALYVSLFRALSYLVPGAGDTNIIIGRKK